MKIVKKASVLFVLLLVAALASGTLRVFASSSTTYTYAFDEDRDYVQTQDAYLPGQTITSLGLKSPADLAVNNEGELVIADAGNARIVIYDPIANTMTSFAPEAPDPLFSNPTGVFVCRESSAYVAEGDIYVADSAAGRVFHFSADGTLLESFGKPNSIMYETLAFEPEKVAVDKAGIMYVVSKGSSDGVVQLSNTGEFLGFFSSNKVNLTLRQQFQQFIYTQEQLDNLNINLTPPVFTSVFIDDGGIVYSSSSGLRVENIKKHTTQGTNMLSEMYISSAKLVDVSVDDPGIIYTADQSGWIDVYTNDGEFIYTFGSYLDLGIAGLFKSLAAIAVDQSGQIWTLDSGNSYLQSFVPTEYASTIYQAIALYDETRYEEAVVLWKAVLRLNQMSMLAHNGIAKNYLQLEEYALAAEHFQIAGNRELYSEAFWELRNIWLQANLLPTLGLILLGVVLFAAVGLADRKTHFLAPVRAFGAKIAANRIIADVLYAKNVAKKPSDAFYYLKKKRHGSYAGAIALLVITFGAYLLFIAGKGFIFQTTDLKDMDLSSIILGFLAIVGLFVLCSYLVTSIQDGEGTLGEIFKGVAYSMLPFILGCVVSTLVSYVATTNELFLLNVIFGIGLAWSLLLVFISISEIQNYTFGETVKSILLTVLFLIVILLVFAFVQMTIKQLFTFLIEIVKEAFRHVLG